MFSELIGLEGPNIEISLVPGTQHWCKNFEPWWCLPLIDSEESYTLNLRRKRETVVNNTSRIQSEHHVFCTEQSTRPGHDDLCRIPYGHDLQCATHSHGLRSLWAYMGLPNISRILLDDQRSKWERPRSPQRHGNRRKRRENRWSGRRCESDREAKAKKCCNFFPFCFILCTACHSHRHGDTRLRSRSCVPDACVLLFCSTFFFHPYVSLHRLHVVCACRFGPLRWPSSIVLHLYLCRVVLYCSTYIHTYIHTYAHTCLHRTCFDYLHTHNTTITIKIQ